MNCPMTIENVKKYGLSDKEVSAFCNQGCSVICHELFVKRFRKRVIEG